MDGISCDDLYERPILDAAYVSQKLGLDPLILTKRLHKLKQSAGLGGRSVYICLDDGEVYVPASGESIGNLCHEPQAASMVIGFLQQPLGHRARPPAAPPAAVPMATVRLHADALDPASVTASLGPAEVAGRKGDALRTTRRGNEVRAKTGTWFISTDRHVQSADPAAHLRWAVDLVAPHMDAITAAVPDVQMDFSLMVAGDEADARALLSQSQDALAAEIRRARGFGTVLVEIPSSGWVETFGRVAPGPAR